MNDTIDFLEELGRDATLRYAPDAELRCRMQALQVDASVQDAIIRRDRGAIEGRVDATWSMCCLIYPVESESTRS